MRIVHIADLHLQEDRFQEYSDVFENLITDIEKILPEFVVIAGDIFDRRTFVRPIEIELFCSLIKWIIDINHNKNSNIHIVIIPGNHDCNMSNPGAMDLISPLVADTFKDNDKYAKYVHYYPKTGIYTLGCVNWNVYSCIDKKHPPSLGPMWNINKSKIPGMERNYEIALFHEPLNGCQLANGTSYTPETRLKVNDLAIYDATLGGDIHKMQFLKPNVAYCGSLVQQNIIEDPLKHGYILWDFKTKKHEFYPVANPLGSMLNLQAYDNIIDHEKWPIYKVQRVDVQYQNFTPERLFDLQKKVKEKYGVNITSLREAKTYTELITQTRITETNFTFNQWLDTQTKLSPQQKKVISDNHTIYGRTLKNFVNSKQYDVLYLEWKNLFIYGNDQTNYIDFTQFQKHDRIGIMGRNYSGKSSIIDIMSFILYDNPIRGSTKECINKDSTEFYVKIIFKYDGDFYTLIRHGDPKKSEFRMFRNSENISKSTIAENYTFLQTIVGRHQDFVNISCQLQDYPMFTSLSQQDQLKYLYEILGIDEITKIISTVKNEISISRAMIKNIRAPRLGPRPSEDFIPFKSLIESETEIDDKIKTLNREMGLYEYSEPTAEQPEKLPQKSLQELNIEILNFKFPQNFKKPFFRYNEIPSIQALPDNYIKILEGLKFKIYEIRNKLPQNFVPLQLNTNETLNSIQSIEILQSKDFPCTELFLLNMKKEFDDFSQMQNTKDPKPNNLIESTLDLDTLIDLKAQKTAELSIKSYTNEILDLTKDLQSLIKLIPDDLDLDNIPDVHTLSLEQQDLMTRISEYNINLQTLVKSKKPYSPQQLPQNFDLQICQIQLQTLQTELVNLEKLSNSIIKIDFQPIDNQPVLHTENDTLDSLYQSKFIITTSADLETEIKKLDEIKNSYPPHIDSIVHLPTDTLELLYVMKYPDSSILVFNVHNCNACRNNNTQINNLKSENKKIDDRIASLKYFTHTNLVNLQSQKVESIRAQTEFQNNYQDKISSLKYFLKLAEYTEQNKEISSYNFEISNKQIQITILTSQILSYEQAEINKKLEQNNKEIIDLTMKLDKNKKQFQNLNVIQIVKQQKVLIEKITILKEKNKSALILESEITKLDLQIKTSKYLKWKSQAQEKLKQLKSLEIEYKDTLNFNEKILNMQNIKDAKIQTLKFMDLKSNLHTLESSLHTLESAIDLKLNIEYTILWYDHQDAILYNDHMQYKAQQTLKKQLDILQKIKSSMKQTATWKLIKDEWDDYDTKLLELNTTMWNLNLYLNAIDLKTGYPNVLLQHSIDRIKYISQELVAKVTPDLIMEITNDFQISINQVKLKQTSGFQRMITNIALRCAMLQVCQVPSQNMTLWIDECLLGSCDSTNMHIIINQLLPTLPIKLYMISHHEELKAAMTKTIPVVRPLKYGNQLTYDLIRPKNDKTIVEIIDEPSSSSDTNCQLCKRQFTTVTALLKHESSAVHKIKLNAKK